MLENDRENFDNFHIKFLSIQIRIQKVSQHFKNLSTVSQVWRGSKYCFLKTGFLYKKMRVHEIIICSKFEYSRLLNNRGVTISILAFLRLDTQVSQISRLVFLVFCALPLLFESLLSMHGKAQLLHFVIMTNGHKSCHCKANSLHRPTPSIYTLGILASQFQPCSMHFQLSNIGYISGMVHSKNHL